MNCLSRRDGCEARQPGDEVMSVIMCEGSPCATKRHGTEDGGQPGGRDPWRQRDTADQVSRPAVGYRYAD